MPSGNDNKIKSAVPVSRAVSTGRSGPTARLGPIPTWAVARLPRLDAAAAVGALPPPPADPAARLARYDGGAILPAP